MTKRTGARQRIVFGRRESEGKSGECCFLWGNGREHGGGGGGVVGQWKSECKESDDVLVIKLDDVVFHLSCHHLIK